MKIIFLIITVSVCFLFTSEGCKKENTDVTTPSGLKYTDIKEGEGNPAAKGSSVSLKYIGTLQDGKVFDSSLKERPLKFTIGNGEVVAGLEEGVTGMKPGGRRKITIPPQLAYGTDGAGGVIPPNATLIFDVEMLDVK